MVELFGKRYGHHVGTATAEEVCNAWTWNKRARTG
jgi:hypothetical protein